MQTVIINDYPKSSVILVHNFAVSKNIFKFVNNSSL